MDILRLHLTEQALDRFNAVPTRRNDFTEDQAALFIQNHCLSAGRTHIESYITHNFSPVDMFFGNAKGALSSAVTTL
jgi:hypothetical protein